MRRIWPEDQNVRRVDSLEQNRGAPEENETEDPEKECKAEPTSRKEAGQATRMESLGPCFWHMLDWLQKPAYLTTPYRPALKKSFVGEGFQGLTGFGPKGTIRIQGGCFPEEPGGCPRIFLR